MIERIGSQQSVLILYTHSEVGGQAVQMDRGFNRPRRIVRVLRQKSGDYSCEQVAAAAFGHSWISGGIHGHAPIGMSDQRPRAFKHKSDAHFQGKAAGRFKAIGLDCSNGGSGQPRHFSRMRR